MADERTNEPGRWDAALYESKHGFVWERGADLVELLAPKPGERILDLGCGTGHLAAKIAATGARVVGLDLSAEMLGEAQRQFPALEFVAGDGRRLPFEQAFDAVFSNAALHWITDPESVAQSVAEALRDGGRFVAELGGQGNVAKLVAAVEQGRKAIGAPLDPGFHPWYFPTLGEYASLLETQGLEVLYAVLFERPTKLEDGPAGLGNWFQMFGEPFCRGLSKAKKDELFFIVEQRLRKEIFREGAWHLDYRRLRIVARKSE